LKTTIFDIKRYAINDGPGIRTTLFFSGCPLRCIWCHNPESWSPRPHLTYKQNRCMGCQSCVQACPHGLLLLARNGIARQGGCPERCDSQESLPYQNPCSEVCPTTALEMCGREWTMDELMAEVEKERDVMEDSGGGVTLCGGEPLMQGEAAVAVLRELGRRHLHRTVDTTLFAPQELVRQVAENCELLLIDLKIMDSEKHRRYTGVANDRILENIRLTASLRTPFYIRIPLIEGVNADEQNIEDTALFLHNLNRHTSWNFRCQKDKQRTSSEGSPLLGVNLLPYHDVGRDKHRRIWSVYNPQGIPLATPSEAVQQRCIEQFAHYGITATIGG